MISRRAYQRIHPVGLLSLMVRDYESSCLIITNEVASWYLYTSRKRLIYATNSITPLERLYRHLKIFEKTIFSSNENLEKTQILSRDISDDTDVISDYRTICWLYQQKYISNDDASILTKNLVKETLDSFLTLRKGSYNLSQHNQFDTLPKFCELDLGKILDLCRSPVYPNLQSNQEKKSNIYINLTPSSPRNTSAILEPQIASKTSSNHQSKTSDFSSERSQSQRKNNYLIACIDDSPSMLRKIESYLEHESLSILKIHNPLNALLMVMRQKPDLILLDVMMPDLDGYELCYLLRRHSSFKKTPIIMVTGKTGLLDQTRARLAGTTGYIKKPFTKTDLVREIFLYLK